MEPTESLEENRLWSQREVARYLGVSVAFLEKDRRKPSSIPFVKFGRAVRYDPADVIAYKNRCKMGGRLGRDDQG